MEREDVLKFLNKPWALIARSRDAYWRAASKKLTPLQLLRIGDELRRHAELHAGHCRSPDDFETHVRVSKLLSDADKKRRR